MENIVTILRRRVAFGALALAVAAVAATAPPCAAAAKDITIAVAMKTQVQRRWAFDAEAMKAEAKKLGVTLIFQWANDNPATQTSQVENLLSQNPSALILVPVDTTAAGRIVNEAHQQNVPVVGYDIGISTAKVDLSVVRNNPLVGVLQAEGALKMAPKGVYALIKGDPGNDVAQMLAKSYDKVLSGKPDIKIVFNQFVRNWDPKTALADAEDVLSAQNDHVNAFVTSNDGMATGVGQAIKGRHLEGKVYLSGLDADPSNLQLIAQGVQTMTVWTDLTEEGTTAVAGAVDLAKHQKFGFSTEMQSAGAGPVPTHLVKVSEVNKDNLCDFITKLAPTGWVTRKEVFPENPNACK